MVAVYRPWGLMHWLLQRTPVEKWSFLGCLGTEVRSLTAWSKLHEEGLLLNTQLIKIVDPPPSRYLQLANIRLTEREAEFVRLGGNNQDIQTNELLTPFDNIVLAVDEFVEHAGESLVVDVTSLPKRFFFPIIKRLLTEHKDRIKNLVVTYTVPRAYADQKLAENHGGWEHIPLFGEIGNEAAEMLIVGVGFDVLGLQAQVESGLDVKLLLPFPAPPSAYERSWELIRRLQKYKSEDPFQIYRTDAKDVSDAFDRLIRLTEAGSRKAILAPFGPKPISIAMCIFAILTQTPVFYTQPSVYHPDYSTGVSEANGHPEIYTYCLRLGGRDIYSVG